MFFFLFRDRNVQFSFKSVRMMNSFRSTYKTRHREKTNLIIIIIFKWCLGKDKDNGTDWKNVFTFAINRNRLSYFYNRFYYLTEYLILLFCENLCHSVQFVNTEYSSITSRFVYNFIFRFVSSPKRKASHVVLHYYLNSERWAK